MNLTFGSRPTVEGAATMVLLSFSIDSLYRASGDNVATAMLARQPMGTVLAFMWLRPDDPVRIVLLLGWVVALRWLEARHARRA